MPQVTDAVVRERERSYFLPYQLEFINHPSRLVIVEKSRRIGFTFGLSYQDVRDCVRGKGMDVWFSSADKSAAEEFIRYCERWFKMYDVAARSLGELVLDNEKDVKALVIEASNGRRVNAMTSNPRRFRSKGGKVDLDEFAFHDDGQAMWKAASPAITWGYPMRVLSTHNGDQTKYYIEVEKARLKQSRFALQTVTLQRAVDDGLVSKILGRPATDEDRSNFLQECRDIAGDEESFLEEYMCVPRSSASAWLPWPVITACDHDEAGKPDRYEGGPCYVGRDIARRRDLSVFFVAELVGDVLWTREIVRLKGATFEEQRDVFKRLLSDYRIVRSAWDQTGMGEPVVEEGKRLFGEHRIAGVTFSAASKQAMSTTLKQRMEDRLLRIPNERTLHESLHSVRRRMTGAGIPIFDAERSEATGHADDYWAAALCCEAATAGPVGPVEYRQAQARRFGRQQGAY